MERLQKYLAKAGVASRRESEKLIMEGRVSVNGMIVTAMGAKVDPDQDEIQLDGVKVQLEAHKYYVLLNKPGGYITTAEDEQGRKTVMDLVQDIPGRIYPVGRLDANTEGLLLLTNDGDLAFRLTHPRFGVSKTYRVVLHGQVTDDVVDRWRKGIELEDGITAPADVVLEYAREDLSEMLVTISEGKNRQIRRMAKATGFNIYHLERVSYAFLTLRGIKRGQYRELNQAEVRRLKDIVS